MKNRFLTFLMIASLIFSLVSCGSPDPGTEPDMDVSVYNSVLDKICRSLADGTAGDSEDEGLLAIYEGTRALNDGDVLSAIGYRIEDINGDNVPELMIGLVNTLDDGKASGSQVLVLYTVQDGEPVCVAESFYRSMYQWAGDGSFYYCGSGGAAYHAFGMFSLPKGGTEMHGDEFYFTDVRDESFSEIVYYHNNTGVWDSAEAEELDVSDDEFWQLESQLSDQICTFEMTQLSSCDPQ